MITTWQRFSTLTNPWLHARLPEVDALVRTRLADLAAYLGTRDWLEDEFTAGDLMMIEVLLRLKGDVISDFPTLTSYVDRGRERPAFIRAFAAQKEVADEYKACSAH